jgi:hypothetical protein
MHYASSALEWSVADGARNAVCGVSSSRHGAMDALSLTLASGEGHALGVVSPVMLVGGVQSLLVYLHGAPLYLAEYDGGVITWRNSGDMVGNNLTGCSKAKNDRGDALR